MHPDKIADRIAGVIVDLGYNIKDEPKYIDVIIKRWEELTGKKAVKINE